MMPDVDGIELLRHVRQDDSLGSVPVVSKCLKHVVTGLALALNSWLATDMPSVLQ